MSLVRDFTLLSLSYILLNLLFGSGIWFWAVENLGPSHHASVVFEFSKPDNATGAKSLLS